MFPNPSQNAAPTLSTTHLVGMGEVWDNKLLILDGPYAARTAYRFARRAAVRFVKPVAQLLVRMLLGTMLLPIIWAALFAFSTIAFCSELPLVRRSCTRARKRMYLCGRWRERQGIGSS